MSRMSYKKLKENTWIIILEKLKKDYRTQERKRPKEDKEVAESLEKLEKVKNAVKKIEINY